MFDEDELRIIRKIKRWIIAAVIVIVIPSILMAIPATRRLINEYIFNIEVIDEETDYENRQMVESTVRAMIANYNTYKMTWETYKDFPTDSNEYTYALQAKMQANTTANSYNLYYTQNSFVWKGNLPADIPAFLPLIP